MEVAECIARLYSCASTHESYVEMTPHWSCVMDVQLEGITRLDLPMEIQYHAGVNQAHMDDRRNSAGERRK